jgi:hypothetical protein
MSLAVAPTLPQAGSSAGGATFEVIVAGLYLVPPVQVDVALTPGSTSSDGGAPAVTPEQFYSSKSDVVSWYGLESIERYESAADFFNRLRLAKEASEYATRLMTLLELRDEDFAPVSLSAARRAWDVLKALPVGFSRVRVFRSDGGAVDMQLRLATEVRLLTAGADGFFQSRLMNKLDGTIERRIHFGPTGALHFLLTGGGE